MPPNARAFVYLNARPVGILGYQDGNTWFQYEDLEPEHPVLGQAFEIDPERRRTASGGVPEWFANLLPERDSALRRMILRELHQRRIHDFALLTYLGEDLPGAVRVVAHGDLADLPEFPNDDTCIHDHPLRFSLAGVQPKFSMTYAGKGLVLPSTGQGGDWIVKLPDRRFEHVPENEYAMLSWARLAAISVPEIQLVSGGELHGLASGLVRSEEYALATRRFDRQGGKRIHQEDFAQVRETAVDKKYDQATYSGVGKIVKAVCPQDVDEYIRRLTAIVVMGNLDAHLKNWTLRYVDGRTAELSPAYDLVAVSAYPDFQDDQLAFSLGNARATSLVTMKNFLRVGEAMGLEADRVAEVVRTTLGRLADGWQQIKRDCPVSVFVASHIEQRLRTLPLMKSR
jgi:HipA-like protein